ncbi:hypothetical protein [uncultured Tateyamaria sp.]|nr:hypothetical protein [uncultured Tateyamaria sp.]
MVFRDMLAWYLVSAIPLSVPLVLAYRSARMLINPWQDGGDTTYVVVR